MWFPVFSFPPFGRLCGGQSTAPLNHFNAGVLMTDGIWITIEIGTPPQVQKPAAFKIFFLHPFDLVPFAATAIATNAT